MSKHSTNGFTLIELMVTISIMVILVTMAVPSLQALIERNAVAGQVDSLVSSLITARSEAIKRNTIVVMCRSNNPEAASPTCAGSGTGWESGWIVFADRGGGVTQYNPSAGDVLIHTQGVLAGVGAIQQRSYQLITFRPTGVITGARTEFTVKSKSQTTDRQRRVCLDTTGRPRQINNSMDTCY